MRSVLYLVVSAESQEAHSIFYKGLLALFYVAKKGQNGDANPPEALRVTLRDFGDTLVYFPVPTFKVERSKF